MNSSKRLKTNDGEVNKDLDSDVNSCNIEPVCFKLDLENGLLQHEVNVLKFEFVHVNYLGALIHEINTLAKDAHDIYYRFIVRFPIGLDF